MTDLDPVSLYGWMSRRAQVIAFCSLLVAMIGLMIWLGKLGAPVKAQVAAGPLALEAPWSTERAQTVLELLGTKGIEALRRQTYVDFVFLLIYPLVLSLGCALLASSLDGRQALFGMLIAVGVLLACPFDALENVSMLRMMDGHTGAPWPQLATLCAGAKFTLIAGAVSFLVVGTIERLAKYY
jgi:hypothetical protein